MRLFLIAFAVCFGTVYGCNWSPTTASGSKARGGSYCSGELIFEDNFDFLDHGKWEHEKTLTGGGNYEFQWYLDDRDNSYTENGVLHIRPTLTSDYFGEAFLTSGVIKVDGCTNSDNWGCERTGSAEHILNPIRSARLRSLQSFNFKYGRVEIRAKMPAGDWLWPALWLLPKDWVYGGWPTSGEIDIVESRGNRNLVINGQTIGPEQVGSTLHFGPYPEANAWDTSHYERNSAPGQGFNQGFHLYQLEWTPDRLTFKVDNIEMGTVPAGSGMWNRGNFASRAPGAANPWARGTNFAPFDQEFHLIMNLAIGGTNYFPDEAWNPDPKPWPNNSPNAATQFWNGRDAWLRTWNRHNSDSHLEVDYVRIYAI